ncbi:hypothetical protein [Oribacterium sp. WCC10]|uniref:hypothetical protein n=1 Tax=Oribacterium sp. WCC10 TaxID=1855343 RepID=UPI0008ED077E|nr:hypothetical protein [Oribacterium sp. WCC10]SFG26902.1 hypothetical protein SAMN05216356_104172 [Oribacterium sp. WCC10]
MTLLAINWGSVGSVMLVIAIVLLIVMGVLYYFGRKMSKQQAEQQPMIDANTQNVSLLIIDKKKMSIKEAVAAGLPKQVQDQTPVYLKFSKLPVVKAKIGPQFMTLMADPAVFDQLPLHKECKVAVAGIYIRKILSVRGGSIPKATEKKGFMAGLREKVQGKN